MINKELIEEIMDLVEAKCPQHREAIYAMLRRAYPPKNERQMTNFVSYFRAKIERMARIDTPCPVGSLGVSWKYHWEVGEWRPHQSTWPCVEVKR